MKYRVTLKGEIYIQRKNLSFLIRKIMRGDHVNLTEIGREVDETLKKLEGLAGDIEKGQIISWKN